MPALLSSSPISTHRRRAFKAITMLQRNFRRSSATAGLGAPSVLGDPLSTQVLGIDSHGGGARQIDPYLIASIIRQEADSSDCRLQRRGGRIMQIMPLEAGRIATAAGIQSPAATVIRSQTNIAIGVAEYAQKLAVMRALRFSQSRPTMLGGRRWQMDCSSAPR